MKTTMAASERPPSKNTQILQLYNADLRDQRYNNHYNLQDDYKPEPAINPPGIYDFDSIIKTMNENHKELVALIKSMREDEGKYIREHDRGTCENDGKSKCESNSDGESKHSNEQGIDREIPIKDHQATRYTFKARNSMFPDPKYCEDFKILADEETKRSTAMVVTTTERLGELLVYMTRTTHFQATKASPIFKMTFGATIRAEHFQAFRKPPPTRDKKSIWAFKTRDYESKRPPKLRDKPQEQEA